MKWQGLASLACVAALAAACSFDDRDATVVRDRGPAAGASDSVLRIDDADRDFVRALTEAGAAEVKLGDLASTHAGSADVKQFGQMMVTDHTAAGERLKQIAITHNADPGAVPLSDEHAQLVTKLSALKGAAFDRQYIAAMVDGHQDVVDTLQSRVDEKNPVATAIGKEPKDVNVRPEPTGNAFKASVNEWAADTLPVTKGHLDRAKAIRDKLDSGRNTTASR